MSESELQELSRKAAACLPEGWVNPFGLFLMYPNGKHGPEVDKLHRSTEACAEIMVRVLWPASVMIDGSADCARALNADDLQCRHFVKFSNHSHDPMLAFRVAVLRALTALKAES